MNRVKHPTLIYLLLLVATPVMMVGCSDSPKAAPDQLSGPAVEASAARTIEIEKGSVRLSVALTPAEPRLSDQPELTVTVTHDQGVQIEKPLFGAAIGDFAIVNMEEKAQALEDGREQLQQTFTLQAPKKGTLEIDPITVYFSEDVNTTEEDVQKIQTEMMQVPVGSVVPSNSPPLASLRQAAPPVELPGSYLLAGLIITIIVTVVAGGIMFALWRRRYIAELVPPLTPEAWAQQALDRLLASGLASMNVKRFYVELTGIVRNYIERSFGVRAPEQTTEEFLHEISGNQVFSADESLRLKEFLESADLVKFAGYRPRHDAVQGSVQRARAFIQLGLLRGQIEEESNPVPGEEPAHLATN